MALPHGANLTRAPLLPAFTALRNKVSFSANDTLLNESMALLGIEALGGGRELGCVLRRLQNREPISIAALGGSISAGSSYTVRHKDFEFLYHFKVAQALRAAFPRPGGADAQHAWYNGALPATGPGFFEHCLEGQLPARAAHLVLLEFAANTDKEPATFERMLRKLLALRPRPAVVIVNTHVWLARGSNIPCWRKNAKAKGDGRPPITLLEPAQKRRQQWRDAFNAGDEDRIVAIAAHYGLPVVSLRAGLLDAVRTSSPTDEPFLQVPYFMHDCKHPTGEGHTYLAQYVLARLLREPSAATGSGLVCDAHGYPDPTPPLLPPPYFKAHGWPNPSSRCARGKQLPPLLLGQPDGFEFTDEGRGKYGYVGTRAGASLAFCLFNGSAVAAAHAAQQAAVGSTATSATPRPPASTGRVAPDGPCVDDGKPEFCRKVFFNNECSQMGGFKCRATCGFCVAQQNGKSQAMRPRAGDQAIWLGYLRSYENMGVVDASCEGACACEQRVDAHFGESRTSITVVQRIVLRLLPKVPGCCTLKLAISNATSSGGHKFKVLSLLLAQAVSTSWRPPGTNVPAAWTMDSMGEYNATDDENEKKFIESERREERKANAPEEGRGEELAQAACGSLHRGPGARIDAASGV